MMPANGGFLHFTYLFVENLEAHYWRLSKEGNGGGLCDVESDEDKSGEVKED
jgi:hypothetical protein